MRFSIFSTVQDAGDGRIPAETLDDFREQAVLADELGYHAVWIGEHHIGPYGVGDLPNPILLGAATQDKAPRASQ